MIGLSFDLKDDSSHDRPSTSSRSLGVLLSTCSLNPSSSSYCYCYCRHRISHQGKQTQVANYCQLLLPLTGTAANKASSTLVTFLYFLLAIRDILIEGDLNAHSNLWDSEQPTDNRGELVTDWILKKTIWCALIADRLLRQTGLLGDKLF